MKQGSLLSPALFLLVMDPLLTELQASGLELSVNRFYAGGFLHTDDIRTLTTSEDSLQAQVALVNDFSLKNFLKLNLSKCEVVLFARSQQVDLPVCKVEGSVLPASTEGRCLGTGGKGISWLLALSKRKSRRHEGPFSTMQGVLVLFRGTSAHCPRGQFWRPVSCQCSSMDQRTGSSLGACWSSWKLIRLR